MNKRYCSKHISYSQWRIYMLRRLFLFTKDIDHLRLLSRSFSNGPELFFARSLRAREDLTAKANNSAKNEISNSHQTGSSVTSSAADRNTHDAPSSSVSNSKKSTAATRRNTKGQQKNTSSVSSTPPSRSLPQSPLLNPRNEDEPPVKQRKRQPTKEDLDRLRYNPWAIALASNVRHCSATITRLPREFLLDWGLVRHPETGNSWFMPKGLLVDEMWEAAQAQADEGTGISAEKGEDGNEDSSESETIPPSQQPKPTPMTDIRSITQSPKFWVLNRVSVQKDLTAPSNQSKQQPAQMIPYKWKYPMGSLRGKDMKSLVWRQDMPEFVFGALRRATVKALKRACLKSVNTEDTGGVWRIVRVDGGVVDEKGLKDGLERIGELEGMGSGGVLVFGSNGTAGRDVVSEETAEDGEKPTPFQTATRSSLPDLISLPIHGSQVPVFDLTALLSESDIDELRQHHPRFQETALFFRPGGNIPVDAMLALWKLKGYVMHDKDI